MSKIFDSYLLSKNRFDDFDEMAAVAAHAWDQRYRKIGREQDDGYVRQLNIPSAQLSDIGWRSALHIETGTPKNSIGFLVQVAGQNPIRVNGQRLERDRIAVLQSPRAYDLLNPTGTAYLVFCVDRQRVLRHAQAHWGNLPARFDSLSMLASESATHQRNLSLAMRRTLELSYDSPRVLDDPNVQDVMIDKMLDAIFLGSALPARHDALAQRHLRAKKAVQYLKDNLEEVVSLRTMCEYAGASERSLRQGFLERYGVTPNTYVKRFRLFQLRDWLRDPAHHGSTITEGALRLGLTHLGRLSAEYKLIFGELPRETRRLERY